MKKEFLSIEEVSSYLDVDTQLIYKLIKSKKLIAFKIGRLFRVRQADLDEYVASCMVGTDSGESCSVCGKEYYSKQMLRHQCSIKDCKEKICVDCYERCDILKCNKH